MEQEERDQLLVKIANKQEVTEQVISKILYDLKRLYKGQEILVKGQEELYKGQEILVKGQEELYKGQEILVKGQEALVKGQEELYKGQEALVKGQEELFKGQEELFRNQKEMREELTRVGNTVAKIEYEHGRKIDLILDVLTGHGEKLEEHDKRLEKDEKIIQNQGYRIYALEQKSST